MKQVKRILFITALTIGTTIYFYISTQPMHIEQRIIKNSQQLSEQLTLIDPSFNMSHQAFLTAAYEYADSIDHPEHTKSSLALLFQFIIKMGRKRTNDIAQILRTIKSAFYYITGYFLTLK